MSALQPPPLPNVPFARVVPGRSEAPASYTLRPVSRAARIFLALPLPVMAALSALFMLKQYRSGASFTHDTNHKFIFFFDAVVFFETWDKGEKFRSGCCWALGQGRVFYFRPGHETYPVFHQEETLRVIHNAVLWSGKRT